MEMPNLFGCKVIQLSLHILRKALEVLHQLWEGFTIEHNIIKKNYVSLQPYFPECFISDMQKMI